MRSIVFATWLHRLHSSIESMVTTHLPPTRRSPAAYSVFSLATKQYCCQNSPVHFVGSFVYTQNRRLWINVFEYTAAIPCRVICSNMGKILLPENTAHKSFTTKGKVIKTEREVENNRLVMHWHMHPAPVACQVWPKKKKQRFVYW